MEQFEEKVDWTPLLEEAVHDTETIMISARVQSSTADLDSLL